MMGVLTTMPPRPPRASALARLPIELDEVFPNVASADQELLLRIARGDDAALRELFTTYGPHAKALAQRVVASPALAEEVVQEVFLAVWRNAGDYRPELGSVRAWLFAAVHNRAVDSVRREESFRRRAQEEAVLIPEAGQPDVAEVVAESDELALRRKRMRAALDQLPEEQRRVLELMYFEGRTQSAIARETGIPLGTVKSRTLLGMRRLRKELKGIDVEVDR
jgi:RNA polymerase sigma factor (sigma-70 family)